MGPGGLFSFGRRAILESLKNSIMFDDDGRRTTGVGDRSNRIAANEVLKSTGNFGETFVSGGLVEKLVKTSIVAGGIGNAVAVHRQHELGLDIYHFLEQRFRYA